MNAVILDRLVRIGIADDNELVRGTLRMMLDCSPNLQVVGEAENGSEAIAMVELCQPDVVLMDISMPVFNGLQATRSITSNFPDTKVIVLGMHTDQTLFRQGTPSRCMPVSDQGLRQRETPQRNQRMLICTVEGCRASTALSLYP